MADPASKILVVGAGGREHALVRALKRSAAAPELLCAPGNPGIAADAQLVAVALDDIAGLVDAAAAASCDLVVIGPEAPLVDGLADELAARGNAVDLLRERGTPFAGVLYAGIMLTAEGPKVLEYNVRFGDPETQAVLPRLRSDACELLAAAARPGGLRGVELEFGDDWAVTLVLASAGYPAAPSTGDVISGLDDMPPQIEVTHAGTARRDDGAIVTAGGRVLNVTALGPTPATARDAAYAAAQRIDFAGRQLRGDIALRAVERMGE